MLPDEDTPPEDGPEQVGRAVAAFTAVGRGPGLLDADGEAVNVSKPLPIYSIGKPQMDSRPTELLKRARRIGWRYLVFQGDSWNIADIKPAHSDRPELIRSDDLVQQVMASGKLAETLTADEADYSVRMLDLSILGQSVLWLVSSQPEKPDRFFSLSPTAKELDAADFLKRMSDAEKQKAQGFASARGESGG